MGALDWRFYVFVGAVFVIGAFIGVYTGELKPLPTSEFGSTVAGAACGVYECPTEITEVGNNGNYTYAVGQRFNVIFNNGTPATDLVCEPAGVAKRIYDTPPGSNTATFEGQSTGTCTVSNGTFSITINIAEQ